MHIERFKDIIRHSYEQRKQMAAYVAAFYKDIHMDMNETIRNVYQVARPLFEANNYWVVEMPFKDKEIGALCYKGDSIGYLFLNSSLPKVNMNFALCHEIYHVFYQESALEHKVELYMNEQYYEHEEELAANLFAGMVLMPEHSFRYMFNRFFYESKEGTTIDILLKLMNYFEAPYMAVLIRCYELELLKAGDLLKELLDVDKEFVKDEFAKLWLEEDLLQPTKKDTFQQFLRILYYYGELYLKKDYINERTYKKAIKNVVELYKQLKEG